MRFGRARLPSLTRMFVVVSAVSVAVCVVAVSMASDGRLLSPGAPELNYAHTSRLAAQSCLAGVPAVRVVRGGGLAVLDVTLARPVAAVTRLPATVNITFFKDPATADSLARRMLAGTGRLPGAPARHISAHDNALLRSDGALTPAVHQAIAACLKSKPRPAAKRAFDLRVKPGRPGDPAP